MGFGGLAELKTNSEVVIIKEWRAVFSVVHQFKGEVVVEKDLLKKFITYQSNVVGLRLKFSQNTLPISQIKFLLEIQRIESSNWLLSDIFNYSTPLISILVSHSLFNKKEKWDFRTLPQRKKAKLIKNPFFTGQIETLALSFKSFPFLKELDPSLFRFKFNSFSLGF